VTAIRVVSFNVKHALTARGRVDTGALARVCASLEADVLALQEVDRRRLRSRFADQAAQVANACGMAFAFGRARGFLFSGYGNALLVRGRIDDVEVVRLPRPRRGERRVALLATATVGDLRLSVAATHLDVRRARSGPQLDVVLAAIARRRRPWLVLGDLNRSPPDVEPALTVAGLTLADASVPTFPAAAPRARIDHVSAAGVAIGAVEVRALPVSDHRAVVVELTAGG
jgi:endonuclease/exonuclease/phosphatase family metal-dependent hydrolase